MGRRGNVLLHVLITGVIVAMVSGLVLRMAMLRYTVGARAHTAAQNLRNDQGVLNAAISAWSGRVCSATPPNCGGGCANNSCGGCSCNCTSGNATIKLKVQNCSNSGGPWPNCGQCQLSIYSGTGYSGNVPF